MHPSSYRLLSLLLLTPAGAFAQTAPPDPTPDGNTFTLWELVHAGGWVMIPLFLASVVALTLIIFLFSSLQEKSVSTPELLRRIDPYLEKEDLAGLAAFTADKPQAVARVLDQTLKFLDRHPDANPEAIKTIAEAEGVRLASQMNQRAQYLTDLGVLTPMLGLFGTVVGILRSFGSIAQESSPMRTLLLAGGVSQALVATASGLIIGITALFFYSYFRGRVQHLISVLESQSVALILEIILIKQRRSRKTA